MSERPVYMLDPGAFTPAYCNALVHALRNTRDEIALLTSESLMDPPEDAGRVPGRRYFYQRLTKRLRRNAADAGRRERLARAFGLPEYLSDLARLFALCAARRPILHVQWAPLPAVDIAFLKSARAVGSSIVYTVHNPVPHDTDAPRVQREYERLYRLADYLVLHSDYALASFEQRFPAVETPRTIIPHGVLFDDVEPVDRKEARAKFGWPGDEIVIVFLGLVKRYKGLDLLLEAMTRANTERPLRLVIGATWRHVTDRAEYDALIRNAQSKHAVDVRDDIPTREETAALMSGADLCVLPYRAASASAPGMIAMRFGIPIIASDTGSFPDILGDDLREWLVPPDDAHALAHTLERFTRLSTTQREAFAQAIAQRADTHFAWPNIAQQTATIYDKLSS